MKSIKIEIPKGYEIDTIDKVSGEVTLKSSRGPVMDRIRTVADVLADNDLTQDQFDEQCDQLDADEVAYRILKFLAKSLNEGWVPDWNNPNEYKYVPWFEMSGSAGFRFHGDAAWRSGSGVGSRLCFKSKALAEHAAKNFTDVYKQFMIIK